MKGPLAARFGGLVPTLLSALVVVVVAAGCGAKTPTTTTSSATVSWKDEPISFVVSGMTVYGTFHHPAGQSAPVPAALLIAGSGPTDRNGNSPIVPHMDTLQNLAQALSGDGVASLRYDKLGSGQTGLGPLAADPSGIGITPFEDEAAAALDFLAAQPGIDRGHLMVIGHSEGALFALLLATDTAGKAPPVQALGLLEPLSIRYLDALSEQLDARAPELTAATADAVQVLRSTGQFPANLPPALRSVFNPSTALFLAQADAYDPADLAAKLPNGMPVLVSCSDADIQVSCDQVDHLVSGLTSAGTATTFTHLTGVNHVLKEDPSKGATKYGEPLPFSSQLTAALASFIRDHLSS